MNCPIESQAIRIKTALPYCNYFQIYNLQSHYNIFKHVINLMKSQRILNCPKQSKSRSLVASLVLERLDLVYEAVQINRLLFSLFTFALLLSILLLNARILEF